MRTRSTSPSSDLCHRLTDPDPGRAEHSALTARKSCRQIVAKKLGRDDVRAGGGAAIVKDQRSERGKIRESKEIFAPTRRRPVGVATRNDLTARPRPWRARFGDFWGNGICRELI